MRYYMVRFVHKINPSPKDVAGPIAIPEEALDDRVRLAAALRKVSVLSAGARITSMRERGGEIAIFPSMPGMTTYWHSIILTPSERGPEHAVFHVAEGSHVAWKAGGKSGRDLLGKKTAERVIAARFEKLRKLYPSLRTKEVLPWGGAEGEFTRHKTREGEEAARRRASDAYHEARKALQSAGGMTVGGMDQQIAILKGAIRKIRAEVESSGKSAEYGASMWLREFERELERAISRRDALEKVRHENVHEKYEAEERAQRHERGDNPRTSSRGSKELLRTIRPYVKLYRDSKTGIAWVEDGSSGMGHSAHPNIHGTGSVTGMRTRGFWGAKDRTVRSHGFIYNIDRSQVSGELDRIARDACRCGGNHGEGARHEAGGNPRVSRALKTRMDKVLGKRR